MTRWAEQPGIRINNFITSKLRLEEIIPESNKYVTDLQSSGSNFALPFMSPAQQQSELTTPYDDFLKSYEELPFCVYTFGDHASPNEPWMDCGQITYVFYSKSVDTLFEIKSYTKDLCKREDWTAADINDFYKSDATNPFDFKSVRLMTGAGPNPSEDEGGRYSYLLVITYDCTYEGINRVDGAIPFSGGMGMWS